MGSATPHLHEPLTAAIIVKDAAISNEIIVKDCAKSVALSAMEPSLSSAW